MGKPRILISGGEESFQNYISAVNVAGGEAIPLYSPGVDVPCDGLVLCGGGDIHPRFLGEPDRGTRDTDEVRDEAELKLVRDFAARGIPMLGICRGHQVVNIALGGKLLQDIGPGLEQFHSPEPLGSKADVYHALRTLEGSQIGELFGPLTMVNSWHHQAVESPGEGMQVTAWSESGIIEATEHESLPILTVQCHPERLWRGKSFPVLAEGNDLFLWLIEACKKTMTE